MASRRQEFSASTKRGLVAVALDLFARQGYAGTSLDEIVTGAQVTKGALYHHFRGKQELYEAAFVRVEQEATDRIRAAVAGTRDPWEMALTALREFLAVTRTDAYRRLVIQDGPAVLGYERFREYEEASTFSLVHDIVAALVARYDLSDTGVEAVTRLFFGAMSATGGAVASAPDADRAVADAEQAIVLVLAGLRCLVDSGSAVPTAATLLAGRG